MVSYIIRRAILMVITLVIISIIAYLTIELPPGDYLTYYVSQLQAQGSQVDLAEVAALEQRFGLNQPVPVRYWKWVSGIVLRGDFGVSFHHEKPVSAVLASELGLSIALALGSAVVLYAIAIPLGVLSAVKQHTWLDYLLTFIGFLGLSVPNFMLALILMFVGIKYFDASVGGLFSPEYQWAAWSPAKVLDMLSNMWMPLVIIGLSSAAGQMRVLRATMLDELRRPYVTTARAKGLPQWKVIAKYPTKVAISPLLSTMGWVIPGLVSGATITAIVLNLPALGPTLFNALVSQDMYLAASIVLVLSSMVVVGTFLSDLLLAWFDPRIRYA